MLRHNRASRRATLALIGLTFAGLALVAGIGFAVVHSDPAPASLPEDSTPTDGLSAGGRARQLLATRAMPVLPLSAAAPQPLASPTDAPAALLLPASTGHLGMVAAGFPPSGEGAVAALIALDETALQGGDPDYYTHVYRQLAVPGTPPAERARLTGLLTSMRHRAGLPATGPVAGLETSYRVTQAQIKGLLDDSRYAVVCVLGQFDAAYQGSFTSYGVGDCQSMAFLGGQWRISPGPPAARAPDAWPGSPSARAVGYVQVVR